MEKTATITLYHVDGHEQVFTLAEHARMAGSGQVGAGRAWSTVAPPPPGWEREVPKYRVRFDVGPTALARFRFEPPYDVGANIWQYADRGYKTGEIIETKAWPHPTFEPLTYGAKKVLEFFNTRSKSRLPTAPWFGTGIRLDDGLSGPIIPAIDVPPPQSSPKPVSAQPRVQHSMRRG
jgi:hypothetical protein